MSLKKEGNIISKKENLKITEKKYYEIDLFEKHGYSDNITLIVKQDKETTVFNYFVERKDYSLDLIYTKTVKNLDIKRDVEFHERKLIEALDRFHERISDDPFENF